ncbi:MAG: hypothetical protein R2825_10170 [Saprospiraceae bacterium]
MKYLPHIMIAAAICWIISEIMEVSVGGYTPLILQLTALFHLLAAIGIWGLHFGQTKEKNKWSLYGSILLTIGYLILTAVPLIVLSRGYSEPGEVVAAYPILKIFGAFSIVGILLFGSAVIKINYFPKWTGIVFIVCSLVTFGILAAKGNMLIANVANIIVSVTMIKMAWQVIQEK